MGNSFFDIKVSSQKICGQCEYKATEESHSRISYFCQKKKFDNQNNFLKINFRDKACDLFKKESW